MQAFTNLIEQFKQFWDQTTPRARVGIVATAALCLVTIVGVGIWSSRPEYVLLVSELRSEEAREIERQLEAAGIPTNVDQWATSVFVPRSKVGDARMAVGDISVGVWQPVADLESDITMAPDLLRNRMLRHQERRLAASIRRVSTISNAEVHISKGNASPFTRNETPTTASVVLELRNGNTFSSDVGAAIVALMVNSVEGLESDRVAVVDTFGRLLFADSGSQGEALYEQHQHKRRIEAELAAKAEGMLAEMLGIGRAVVRVTADMDFTQTKRKIESYDAESNAKVQETISNTSSSRPEPIGRGVVGASANVGDISVNEESKLQSEEMETIDTKYVPSVTKDEVVEQVGQIKSLAVAAAVDLSADGDGDTATSTTVTKEDVEDILKTAIGYSETRNDQIKVVVTKLAGVDLLEPVAPAGYPAWESINELLRNISLGLASIVALVLGIIIVRRMSPVADSSTAPQAVGPEQVRQIADLSQRALANPEALSRIMHAWLNEARQEGDEERGSEQGSEHASAKDTGPNERNRDAMAA